MLLFIFCLFLLLFFYYLNYFSHETVSNKEKIHGKNYNNLNKNKLIIIIIIRARHFTCYYICTVWITVCQMQILCLLEVSSVHVILEKMGIHSHDAKFLGSLYKTREAFNCEFWRLLKDIYTISITYHFQECNPIFAYHGTFSFLWLLFEITLEVLMNKTSLTGSKPDFVLSHV